MEKRNGKGKHGRDGKEEKVWREEEGKEDEERIL